MSGPAPESTARPVVLLVDDEPPILRSLARLLAFDPYEIVTACNASEALELLIRRDIAVVLSDQHMPGLTGVDLLRRCRERAPETTRILFSGHIDIELLRAAVNGGEVYRFVTKPWDDDELLTAVRQGAERHHLLRQNRLLRERTEAQNVELLRYNHDLTRLVASRTEALAVHDRSLDLLRGVLDRLPVAVLVLGDLTPGGDPGHPGTALANRLAQAAFPDGLSRELAAWARSGDGLQEVNTILGTFRCEALSLTHGGAVIMGVPVSPVLDEP